MFLSFTRYFTAQPFVFHPALAAGPVRAMVRTRALVRGAAVRTLDEHLDDEARLIAESAVDPEGREGVRAFVEKRRPDFRAAR